MVRDRYAKILRGGAALLAAFVVLPHVGAAFAAPTGSIIYKDKLGKEVAVSLPVRRAVFLVAYELVPVLGVWDRVVGVARWVYDNDLVTQSKPDIRSIPSVGSGSDVNIETLLRLKPDLVVTWTFKPEQVRFMEQRGFPVVGVYPDSIAELYDVMRFLGRAFQREDRMDRAIGEMEALFRLVGERVSRIPEAQRKRVLYIGSKPTTASGQVGVTNDMIALIGARNPASVLQQRNADVPLEKIIAWDPDVIIIWGNAHYDASDLTNDPRWRLIPAVRKGQVYKAPEWSTWSPRLAPYALWMAAITYPEQFKDIAADKVVNEFHRKVFGVPGKAWH
jgi:iron complex transport system substrate-binding protein